MVSIIAQISIHMIYELFNPSTTISRKFSRQSWVKGLELAMLYGWRPKGTRPPSHHDFHLLNADWQGIYLTNDGQIVTREDAFSLAAALQKSLDDIPNENIKIDWDPKLWTDEDDLPEWLSPDEKVFIEEELEGEFLDIMGIHPFEFFRGDDKQLVTDLIRFCRLGSFIIM
jgi:hypothetical protein